MLLSALHSVGRTTQLAIRRLVRGGQGALHAVTRLPRPARYALCFLWGFAIAALIWVFVRRPEPHIHDEASYLLAADTYARGRWTNPALPENIRAHFEALHIIVAPTYMSKYPPGQGLMLALGVVLGNNSAIGLWINAGLVCCGALYALTPWVPRRWATLAALLVPLHPLVLKWTQTFWGGNLPLFEGLLLLGAIGRLVRPGKYRGGIVAAAATLALALGLLANTRPFEGLVAACLLAIPLLPVLWKGITTAPLRWITRFLFPAAAVLGSIAAVMLIYNVHVTGKATRMPYAVHEDVYGTVPLFLFQEIKPIPLSLRHDTMRFINAYTCVYGYLGQRDAWKNIWQGAADKADMLARSAFQLFDPSVYWLDTVPMSHPYTDFIKFIPALILVPGLWLALQSDGKTRFAVFCLVAFNVVLFLGTFINPHYGAPIGGMALLVWVQAWRYIRVLTRKGKRVGLGLSRLVLVLYAASAATTVWYFTTPDWEWMIQDRRPVRATLNAQPGNHLVLVYYGATNVKTSAEWVYNGADIPSQKIIWARYLSPKENEDLIRYFPGRQVWLLDATVAVHPHLYRFDPKLLGNLPFPERRVIDPGVASKLKRGLKTKPEGLSGVAALPLREQRIYHKEVRERSRVRRILATVPEVPLQKP